MRLLLLFLTIISTSLQQGTKNTVPYCSKLALAGGCDICDTDAKRYQVTLQQSAVLTQVPQAPIYYCCPKGCTTCVNSKASPGVCVSGACDTGYGMSAGKCVPCSEGCSDCDKNNINLCTACKKGYYKAQSGSAACSKCDRSCNACKSFGEGDIVGACTECNSNGFWKDSNSKDPTKCAACSSNCNTCSSLTSCTSCSGFWKVKDGVCVEMTWLEKFFYTLMIIGIIALVICVVVICVVLAMCCDFMNKITGRRNINNEYNSMGY